ncbi:MAG: T9SS type A sorting domain-containing protein, partial [Bacteroidia bacterium]
PTSHTWLVKLDITGNIQWQKCLISSTAMSVDQTTDSGYVIGGSISNFTTADDFRVIKVDASGNLQWQQSYGGSLSDDATSIQQTNDGGYIVAGVTSSNNGDVSGNHGGTDYWTIKLDAVGNLQWQRCLGGTLEEDGGYGGYAPSIEQTIDNGFVLAGWTKSNDGDVGGNHGNFDYWLVKLNTTGNIQWQKCLGGTGNDLNYSARQTNDGGFIVAGYSSTANDDVLNCNAAGFISGYDYWIVKLGPDPTSIQEIISSHQIQIFPNPSNDKIYFSQLSNIELYSITSQFLLKKHHVKELEVSQFEKGVYLLKFVEENIFRKIIIN